MSNEIEKIAVSRPRCAASDAEIPPHITREKSRIAPFLPARSEHFDAMIRNHEKTLANSRAMLYNTKVLGDMAQLVERYVRIV